MGTYYHFTSGNALKAISEHGLTIGDIPTDIPRVRGRCGVWLTSDRNPIGLGLAGSRLDKCRCCVQVSISEDSPFLHRWLDWAPSNVLPETITQLHVSAGEGSDPSTWLIYLAWLKPEFITSYIDTRTDAPIEDPQNFWNIDQNVPPVRYRDKDRWHRGLMRQIARLMPDRLM